MTNNEILALVGIGGAAIVIGVLIHEHNKTAPAANRPVVAQGSTVGNLISQFGGAAAATLGKELGSDLGHWLS